MSQNIKDDKLTSNPREPTPQLEPKASINNDIELIPGMVKESSGWDVYNNEAKKVDTELVNDWRASLNSLLLFAAIFAAVLTAFIIESKKMLEQDPTAVMMDVMIRFTNNAANETHIPYIPSDFEAPPHAVTVNCLFFASLSTSLVAALASVVALQWVADYDAAITRGGSSPEDRAKRRQFRYTGVISWKMGEIIAALPLLLYFSVILFFAGLILWMQVLHHTVGLVVAGGAALAALFYVVSTLVAVAFVSAPFRTPLSQWIYSFMHLILLWSSFCLDGLRIGVTSKWLNEQRQNHRLAHKREDTEVNRREELALDSLVWLANHLSLSQDSYRRFLLLASELPKLPPVHFLLPTFREAPWFSIFDLLGWRNRKADNSLTSSQKMEAFAVLADCYKFSPIYDVIRPKDSTKYYWDDQNDEYWSQYSISSSNQWTPYSTQPNSLFLLLRDIPLPCRDTPKELESTIRLSQWRNSVATTSVESAANSDYSFKPRTIDTPLYIRITNCIISPLIKNGGTMSPADLDLLRWRHESILLDGFDMDEDCLSMPSRYQSKLQPLNQPEPLLSLHFSFTLLLARNLGIHSGSERVTRVAEILVMLWAYGAYNGSPVDDQRGMKNFFDRNMRHIVYMPIHHHPNPYIDEIFHHLAHAQATQDDIGLLWKDKGSFLGWWLIETLPMFDSLIRRGATPTQHCTLIDLICRDIELHPPGRYAGPTIFRLSNLDLKDPCLAFLTAYARGVHDQCIRFLPSEGQNAWEKSWLRIISCVIKQEEDSKSSSLLQLKAALWPMISLNSHELRGRATRDPQAVVQLQRIFEYPVRCPDHHDHDGHILLDMFEGDRSYYGAYFHTSMERLTKVPLKGRHTHLLLALLVLPDDRLTDQTDMGININEECWSIILEISSAVKSSQLSFLSILCGFDTSYFPWSCEEMAAFSICIHKSLDLPLDQAAVHVVQSLVRRLDGVGEKFVRGFGVSDLGKIAGDEFNVAMNRLNAHLASVLIHGMHNKRMLSCARANKGWIPATGWLPAYID